MSTSSNNSQSAYSPSEPETPQGTAKSRIQALDQSLNNVDVSNSNCSETSVKEKEMHQKRIQALRKELEYIKVTEWAFDYDKGFIQ